MKTCPVRGSHLLRDLAAIEEQEKEGWATEMNTLLQEVCHEVRAVRAVNDAKPKGKIRFNAPIMDCIEDAYKIASRMPTKRSCVRSTAIIVA